MHTPREAEQVSGSVLPVRTLTIISGALLALFLLIISTLPLGIELGIVSWLNSHGVKDAKLDNVDLNLFSGSAVIEGLRAGDGLKIDSLQVDIDWWPLWKRIVHLRSVKMNGSVLQLAEQDGRWGLAGIQSDDAEEGAGEVGQQTDSGAWLPLIDTLSLEALNLEVKTGRYRLKLPVNRLELSLSGVKSQQLVHEVELGAATFSGFGYQAGCEGLSLAGELHVSLLATDIPASLSGKGIQMSLNGLKIDTAEGIAALLATSFRVENVNFEGGDRFEVGQLAMDGVTLQPALAGRDFAGLSRLASIGAVRLQALTMQGTNRGRFESLQLQQIQLPADAEHSLGSIGLIRADSARLNEGDYHLKRLLVEKLQADIEKRQDGKLAVLAAVSGSGGRSDGSADAAGTKTQATNEAPMIIDEVVVSPGSRIRLADQAVFPPFKMALQVNRMRLAPLDSSGKKPGRLDAELALGQTGSLAINGELKPLSGDAFSSDLRAELKDFDLSLLSGYIEKNFGKSIKTGQFNLGSSVKIENNIIDARNRVVVRKLELGRTGQTGKAGNQLGMPVDAAVNLLTDDRGDIELEVPVTGRLDNPDVNLAAVINKALTKAMGQGALAYASYALQPYGAMILAADIAGGLIRDATRPRLTPILFEERSEQLAPDMSRYIAKIAALMKNRDFRLQICGIATIREGEAVQGDGRAGANSRSARLALTEERLIELAQLRADAVTAGLQAHGIASDRLFSCRPLIDEAANKAKPRVELLLD